MVLESSGFESENKRSIKKMKIFSESQLLNSKLLREGITMKTTGTACGNWLKAVLLITLINFFCGTLFATDGLAGYWRFDEGSGTSTADRSGNGNNGSLYNMNVPDCWIAGKSSMHSLQFDGINDYVLAANSASLNITQEITVAAWIKPDTRTDSYYHVIACKGSYTYFLSTLNGTIRLLIGKSDRSGWNTITVGQTILDSSKWYHVVGTYKNGIGKIYINGVLDGTTTGSDENIGSYVSSLSIGSASSYESKFFFNGVIDELRIYNQALGGREIEKMFIAVVGGWHFNETDGLYAADFSGNENVGILNNMEPPVCWVTGKSGQALQFDGINDYVSVPDSSSLNIAEEITVESWVRPDIDSGHNLIAAKGNSYFLSTYNGKAAFRIGKQDLSGWNASAFGQTSLANSTWYHIAGTYKNGICSVYVNGLLDGTATGFNENIGVNDAPLSIGSGNAYGLNDYYFNGVIDELNIYSKALSNIDLIQHFLSPDLKANWEFDCKSGGTLTDGSGNSNNGTLYSMNTPSCWVDGRVGQALQFDGINDYVLAANSSSLNITGAITVEAWIKPDARTDYHVIACKGSYTYFLSTYYGKTRLLIGKQNRSGWNVIVTGNTTLDSSKWYHIVGTYKNGIGKIYVNGAQDGTATGSNENIGSYTSSLSIGSASSYSSNYYFQGIIDQVNLFSGELTTAQINARFIDHGGAYGFGCEEQPTGDPIGGGTGYRDIKSAANANYVVGTKSELLSALSSAQSGQLIFVTGTATIDLTGTSNITIPGGVTLASDRGYNSSSGALLKTATVNTSNNFPLFIAGGSDIRVTGLRLQGPASGINTTDYSDGIMCKYPNLKVDNCEISAWAHAGIHLSPVSPNNPTNAHIHHNYIHHCQRNGLGYGICLGFGNADGLIEANKFDYFRHAVAGTGTTGNSYEARYNLVLENNNINHVFDMHGGADRLDGTNIAGDNISIHHNTIKVLNQYGVNIRGIPNNKALIYNNWFFGLAAIQINAVGNMEQYMNLETTDRIFVKER